MAFHTSVNHFATCLICLKLYDIWRQFILKEPLATLAATSRRWVRKPRAIRL